MRSLTANSRDQPRANLEKAPASYRAISGPSGPKSQKSQKRVKKGSPGPSSPRSPKSPKRVRKESKMSLKGSFLSLFGLFLGLFWTPGTGGPGRPFLDSFLTLLGFRARRARNGSVAGGGFLKANHPWTSPNNRHCSQSCHIRQVPGGREACARLHAKLGELEALSGPNCAMQPRCAMRFESQQGERPPKIRKKVPRNKVPGNFWPSSH